MKKSILPAIFLIGSMALFTGCKKSGDVIIDTIDPNTQPSELSKSLQVKGTNKKGVLPDSTPNLLPRIPRNLVSASVTNDNTLFLSFTIQNTGTAKGLYLSVQGADNYWDIPLTATSSLTRVLTVGISAKVLTGAFKLVYRMYDANGNVGNKAVTNVAVVEPAAYCKANGSVLGARNGSDGVDAMRYTLGDTKGWVTIEYDMYTIKDRMDVKYNGTFVRSTGSLLQSNATPPIGKCDEVGTNGDGFVSGTGKFQFFYDPAISNRVDVFVSGCLDGGTAWTYRIVECPKEIATLGIHSNLKDNLGHGWISITEKGVTTLWGLWPDWNKKVKDANMNTDPNVSDVRKNLENGLGSYSRYYQLNSNQLQIINNLLAANKKWTASYNCASLVEEIVNTSGVDNVNFDGLYNGSNVETPEKMRVVITEKESKSPTNTYKPGSIPIDAGSCSLCF